MRYNFRGASFEAESHGRNDFDDEQSVRERWWHIEAGQVVLDVGAAIGSYTLPALALGADVITFSGQRDHAAMLKANLSLNPGFTERTIVLPYGLYDEDGYLACDGSSYKFVETMPVPFGPEDLVVRRMDNLRLGVDRIDWIKIDVEGAELKVLEGAERTIRKYLPKVLVENHQFMDKTLEARVGYFMLNLGLGYTMVSQPWNEVSHSLFEIPR